MIKKTLFFAAALIIFGFWFGNSKAASCTSHNVGGWVWSSNIGWISMSCESSGSSNDYGVDIDPSTGAMSGYAWSSNIGWISFNSSDVSSCGSAPSVDLTTGQVSGWAKALSADGNGWDGCIELGDSGGTWPAGGNQVSIDSSTNPSQFHGYAWGSDVVGWISFNCSNEGNCTYSYKATTTLVINANQPPTAAIGCDGSLCSGSQCSGTWSFYQAGGSCIFTFENKAFDPDGPSDITQSQWFIKPSGGSYTSISTCSGLCNYTAQQSVLPGNYTAMLQVTDTAGHIATTTQAFTVLKEISADFLCSLDGLSWQSCTTFKATQNQIVYFKDTSTASAGASINSRTWSDNGSVFNSGNNIIASTTFSQVGIHAIKLVVTDTNSRSASKTYNINAFPPLPKWMEVPPVSWIRSFLASVTSALNF